MSYEIDLTGKTAVVTGAGGVLCSMFSKTLAEHGAKIALIGRTYSHVKAVEDAIVQAGGTAKAYKADVLKKDELEAVHQQIRKDLGPCDLLLNGAGGNNAAANTTKEYYEPGDLEEEDVKSFFDLDQEGFQYVMNLNFIGTLLPIQVFAQDMLGRENCSILNISSMNAFTPLTKIPAYSGAKSAVTNFTQWLAVHFSKEGIRVNAMAPGFFVTKQNKDLLYNADGTPTARTGKILAATPMERFGKPEELNGTLLYLADENLSGFVTGVTIPVDGGFSAYSGV
ncbi:MAG: SDR family oxidoreductase [Oscillospiraceae bacterium]|nr:SDR family oxidoreductase [Oscillospiraceae bacterium]